MVLPVWLYPYFSDYQRLISSLVHHHGNLKGMGRCTAIIASMMVVSTYAYDATTNANPHTQKIHVASAETSINISSQPDFYVSKICTKTEIVEDQSICTAGYVAKLEQSSHGEWQSTVLLDKLDSYGWQHTSLTRLSNNIYLVYMGCGNYCGGYMLVGRGKQTQYFDYWFKADSDSECTVEYDSNKQMWVARSFFSTDSIKLTETYGQSESAVMPKYLLEFTHDGKIQAVDWKDDTLAMLNNPCQS